MLCWHISAEHYGETQLQKCLSALTVRAVALIVSFCCWAYLILWSNLASASSSNDVLPACWPPAVWGMRVEKTSSVAFIFSSIFDRPKTFVTFAPRLDKRYNHAHEPGQHMWLSLGPWPYSKGSQTVEVGCSCSDLKPCQHEISTDEIQERKNYRERSNIDWLSATQNGRGSAEDFSTQLELNLSH